MEDVLRHLVRGWSGFIDVLLRATEQGTKLPREELNMLKQMQSQVSKVISRQEQG